MTGAKYSLMSDEELQRALRESSLSLEPEGAFDKVQQLIRSLECHKIQFELDKRELFRHSAEAASRIDTETGIEIQQLFLFSILDDLPAFICLRDINHRIRFANRAFAAKFGNWEGETCHSLYFGNSGPCENCPSNEVFLTRKPVEHHVPHFSDSGIFHVHLYPFTGNDGSKLILEMGIDITKKMKNLEELGKKDKLESLGFLAGGIAHDFNNLLTGIVGNISLAAGIEGIPGEAASLLDEAERVSLRATELARHLLTFSRGGSPVKKKIMIGKVASDAVNFSLSGSKVRCDFEADVDLKPAIVDEGQICQLIHNLATNAAEAMPRGGTVSIACRNVEMTGDQIPSLMPGQYVCISISDEGAGIPSENLNRIFDPYFTTKQKGTGLGLSTAYSIAIRHDGHITVESLPGKGSTFRVYLPASVEDPPVIPVAPEPVAKVAHEKRRVLVMDDEAVIRKVASVMIQNFGFEAEAVSNGAEAIRRYRAARETGTPFDLVILDLTIPGGMGGDDTLKELKELDPEVKAIVSSGYYDNPVLADFASYGFVGILPKPYRMQDLGVELSRVFSEI